MQLIRLQRFIKHYKAKLGIKRKSDDTIKETSQRNFQLLSTANQVPECIELFQEVFQESMTKEFWYWKYQPYGMTERGICAIQDEKVIGHYNAMAREILYFGQPKKALAVGDTMVSPRARGGIRRNSPFYNMAQTWIHLNLGLKKKFSLAYGFPNHRVMSLAEKVGLYKEVDSITEITWYIKNHSAIMEESVTKYTSSSKNRFAIQTIWKSMALDFKESIIGVRDHSYIKYRYLEHPKYDYSVYLIENNKKEPYSCFILKKVGNTMLLIDLIAKKDNISAVISAALHIAEQNNCDKIKCWITTSKANLFDVHSAEAVQTDISVPTSNITPEFEPIKIKDKWFLMYGDTDFI